MDDAKKILNKVERKDVVYQVGHNRRFAPLYKYVKSLIDKEFHPYVAHVKMNRGELQEPRWVANHKITGGFLYESTIHLLDIIRWLMGEVSELYCVATSNVYAELDDFTTVLKFENGTHASFTSSAHATWLYPFESIELYGEHKSVVTKEMELVEYSQGLKKETVSKNYSRLPIEERWGYLEEDKLFVDSVVNNCKPPVTAWDGYKAVELVEACYESARNKKSVKILKKKRNSDV